MRNLYIITVIVDRARRISQNLFGIISNRLCVLRAPTLLPPESVRNVVMAILVLHNYLRQSSSHESENISVSLYPL